MLEYLPDGQLSVSSTAECQYFVEYDNKLGGRYLDKVITTPELTIVLQQGEGSIPETMTITDKVTSASYTIVIPENSKGDICVPWFVGA